MGPEQVTQPEHALSQDETALLSQLNLAFSRAEGLALLGSRFRGLSDRLAATLAARATTLKAAGETTLSEDYSAWASEARALVTRRLARSARDEATQVKFLSTQRERFDDAFYDLCFRIASARIHAVDELLQLPDEKKPAAAAVAAALEDAATEVGFLTAVAQTTNQPSYRDKTSLLLGTLLLFRSRWEAQRGETSEARRTSAEAGRALQLAAASSVLSAELRALAEMRLAALAFPSEVEAGKQHQEAALSLAQGGKVWNLVATIRRDLAYWAQRRGDWKAAWDLYRENIELSERRIWNAQAPGEAANVAAEGQTDCEGAVEACLHLAKSDPTFYQRALESAEHGKARAFLRTLATLGVAARDDQPGLRERRSRILNEMYNHPASTQGEAERLLLALGTVEEQLGAYPKACALDLQCVPCNYGQMCALVPPDGVILSYFTLPDRLLIFVLGENGLVGGPEEVKVPRTQLTRWAVELQAVIRLRGNYESIDAMQKALGMSVPAFNAPLYLRQLHKVLLEPVAHHLKGKHLTIIVPHGILSSLPFQALIDDSGRALIDDSAVVYAAGLSLLRWCQAHRRTALNTCFAAGVCTLAGGPECAEPEAALVAQAFGARPGAATREAVLRHAADCDVIHLACHSDMGRVFTSFAGLALEDGALCQHEIAGMRSHATLVTLSACETARADTLTRPGTELAGLVGAFFRAGCPSVIASLWPAADEVALPLAEHFYAALKKDPAHIAEALRQAQLAIKARAAEGYDHPYFWAPFCLWGSF